MREQLIKRLTRANDLLNDFLQELPEEFLTSKLEKLPSNEIGQQFWCVIGARHSYMKAAKAGSWQGFECPLDWDKTSAKQSVGSGLETTFKDLSQYLNEYEELSLAQEDYLLDLLEHEIQHHGQLVRYMYGLKLGAPESWKQRYNLD